MIKNISKEQFTSNQTHSEKYNQTNMLSQSSRSRTELKSTPQQSRSPHKLLKQQDSSLQKVKSSSITTKKVTHQKMPISCDNFHRIFIINSIFNTVEKSQALKCNFIHFFVALIYIQAHKLALLCAKQKQQSYSYDLLQTLLKKTKIIYQSQPLQIQECLYYEATSDCLAYYKHNNEYYLEKLRAFLDQYKTVMNNYMPVYYEYFYAVAHYDSIFTAQTTAKDIKAYLKQVIAKVAVRYSNCAHF